VADGFQQPQAGVAQGWPLAPGAVVPATQRATVRAARQHPQQVSAESLASLLGGLPGASPQALQALQQPARTLLANWSSLHNLGMHWAPQPDWQLLALRFDGLPAWRSAAAAQGLTAAQGLAPWCCLLDLMLGRCLDLLGPQVPLLLLTDDIAAPAPWAAFGHDAAAQAAAAGAAFGIDGADELAGAAGAAAAAAAAIWPGGAPGPGMPASGGLLLAGPGVVAGALAAPVSGLAIGPTVLGLLGLPGPGAPGLLAPPLAAGAAASPAALAAAAASARLADDQAAHTRQALCAPVADDAAASAWLLAHAVAPADTAALRTIAQAGQAAALVGWAAARAARGRQADVVSALQQAVALAPADAGLRLLLAQALFDAGQAPACQALLAAWPVPPAEPMLGDAVAGLQAVAAADPARAAQHLGRLLEFAPRPAAAAAAAWLGRARLAQADGAGAVLCLAAALREQPDDAPCWAAWGQACLGLGQALPAAAGLSAALLGQPANPLLLRARAAAWAQAGHADLAEADRRHALAVDAAGALPGAA